MVGSFILAFYDCANTIEKDFARLMKATVFMNCQYVVGKISNLQMSLEIFFKTFQTRAK